MAKPKTKPTTENVEDFITSVADEQKRKDAMEVLEIMEDITGEKPKMWGPSIIGFGSYHYKYASGKEGDWMLTGFSPRKNALSIYLMDGSGRDHSKLEKLGKYKTGASCLYVKKLSDIDIEVLKGLIKSSVDAMIKKYNS